VQAALSPQRDLVNQQSAAIKQSRFPCHIGRGTTQSAQTLPPPPSIFVSHASADRGHAEKLISFLEAQHFECWVSFRDIPAGENYQAAITRTLRGATVLLMIFTNNANVSAEIQKELSLASRYRLKVIPLRMELVEPGDALAYELATHQWIDAFGSWSIACDRLLSQLAAIVPTNVQPPRLSPTPRKPVTVAAPARGALFIPPRKPPPTRARAVVVRVAKSADDPMGGRQARNNWFIDTVKFSITAVGVASSLYEYFLKQDLPPLWLVVWMICVISYTHLVGMVLGGFVAVSRTNQAVRSPHPTG
jgi:hypothetical protein